MMDISYVIYAMQRTGQHGIINWIMRQADGEITHVNFGKFQNGTVVPTCNHKPTRIVNQGSRRFFITNFEDYDLTERPSIRIQDFKPLSESVKIVELIIVRDTRNWLASVLKGAKRNGHCRDELMMPKMNVHKLYFNEYNCLTNLVPRGIFIVYDWWFKYREYREMIARKLGLRFSDAGLNIVSDYGRGSSFDMRNYDGNAQNMDVCNRWKSMKDDAAYVKYAASIDSNFMIF